MIAPNTIRLTPQEQALLAAIAQEVETLQALGHSEESIALSVNLALNFGSIGLTSPPPATRKASPMNRARFTFYCVVAMLALGIFSLVTGWKP